MKSWILALVLTINSISVCAQTQLAEKVQTGADRMEVYLPLLKNKKVAIFANPTTVLGKTHLVDTLLKSGIKIVKIFGPEHGFRGDADAGEHVGNQIDKKTGIPIVSLYGNHKKPTAEDLADVDVVLFDVQDVGVRFYTYISSLEYVLEACIELHKPLMILDRPNPNGFYVDGPILNKKFKSFVGMQPIPVVHGLTIGEYTMMLLGEKWLSEKANNINSYNISTKPNADTPFHVQVIKCKGYTHQTIYELPVMPSPNLKDMQSIYWYPSTCFFEGTVLSEGRGTEKPFQIFGHPTLPKNLYAFTPSPNAGAKSSKCFYQQCFGWNLSGTKQAVLKEVNNQIQLKHLLKAYELFPGKDSFFLKNNFIDKLAGTDLLKKQILEGKTEAQIRASWEPDLTAYKAMRKKYLLYADFK